MKFIKVLSGGQTSWIGLSDGVVAALNYGDRILVPMATDDDVPQYKDFYIHCHPTRDAVS